MVNIVFNGAIQPENQKVIGKYLEPWLWLTPPWCHQIYVNLWDSDGGEQLAEVTVRYEYRRIQLTLYTCWLDRPEKERVKGIVHELIHGFIAIMADYARNSFDILCPDEEAEKFNKHLQAELAQRHEAATEDLANVLYDKFYAK